MSKNPELTPQNNKDESTTFIELEKQPGMVFDFDKIAEMQDTDLIKSIDRGVYSYLIRHDRSDDRIESYTQETGHVLPTDAEKAGRLVGNVLTMYKPRQRKKGVHQYGFTKAAIAFSPEGLEAWLEGERQRSFRTKILTSIPQFKTIRDYAYRQRDERRRQQIYELFEQGIAKIATEDELRNALHLLSNE